MNDDQNRGLEVGESSSVVDFVKSKLRKRTGNQNGTVINPKNPDVTSFVEQNSTSQWAKKGNTLHSNYQYSKPEQDNEDL